MPPEPPAKPDPSKSVLEQYGSWDAVYRNLKPEDLPWNAGGPDPDLVRLVDSGTIPVGRAIDLGTGPGHDAIYLAQRGFRVTAIDVSAAAIELAEANAKKAKAFVEFKRADVLGYSPSRSSATFVNDRGCFHVLAPGDRETYIQLVQQVLIPGGHLFLRTFSDKEPPGPGPYRFTRKELEDLFSPAFDFLEFREGVFEGPRKPKAHLCLLQKKP